MYSSLFNFTEDFFSELDKLQRHMNERGVISNIRHMGQVSFPAVNIGTTQNSVEVYAFAPGVEAKTLDVQLEKNILTLQGERVLEANSDEKSTLYAQERFSGKFKRVISLPDDVDANQVKATYRDGVLRVSIARREATVAKRIEVQ